MSSSKIRRAVISTLVIVPVIAILWSLYILLPQVQTARLPDGATLTLRGWSYGKHHVLMGRSGAWWQLFLPLEPIEKYDTERDSLVVWLTSSTAHPLTGSAGQQADHWWDWVEVLDEQGHRVVSTNPNQQPPYLVLSNNNVQDDSSQTDAHRQSLTIHSFPRLGKKVILRFYDANRPQPVAVFSMPNPTPGPYPYDQSAALPCISQDGDLKCTLKGLSTSHQYYQIAQGGGITTKTIPNRGLNLQPGESLGRSAAFQVEKGARVTRDWAPSSLTISDSTGNEFDLRIWGSGPGNTFDYLAPYCTGEPLLMKVHFERSLTAEVPQTEQWSLPALPLPKPGSIVRSNSVMNKSGINFRVLGIAGPGNFKWQQSDKNNLISNVYSVQVRITPPDQGYSVYVRGMDGQGHSVKFSAPSSYLPASTWQACAESGQGMKEKVITLFNLASNSRSYSYSEVPGQCIETFFFEPRASAKSLRLTFAVNRSYDFKFTIPPLP